MAQQELSRTTERVSRASGAARTGARRALNAYSGEHAVYGIVLVTALTAVGFGDDTDLDVLLFVLGTVAVFWLAHIYAAVVASRAAHPPPPVGAAIVDQMRHVSGMVVAMLVPAALLLLAVVGWVDEWVAYYLALGSGVVMLALIGYTNAARDGSPWRRRIAGALMTTALGVLVVLLSILVH